MRPSSIAKGREIPKKGALPSLWTKVAFSTYSYPRSSAYKKGDGAHVDTERCPTYLALPLSTPTFDLNRRRVEASTSRTLLDLILLLCRTCPLKLQICIGNMSELESNMPLVLEATNYL